MHIETRKTLTLPGLDAGSERWFVSDLHAGDGGRRDDFAPRASLFQAFIRQIRPIRLILVGDTFEGWQCRARGIRAAYPWLSELVRRGVRGNHDRRIAKLPERLVLGNLLVMHGHQADPWNSRYRLVGKLLSAMAGVLELLGWEGADDVFTWPTPARLLFHRWSAYLKRRWRPWCQGVLRASGCRLLVCGHTHRAELVELPDGRAVANCGTWAGARLGCHAVCTHADTVKLMEIG